MSKHGPEFYDTEQVFEIYSQHRANLQSPNETIEQPLVWKLIGDPKGLHVLDLGCGEAKIARRYLELGALSYLGVEGSERMFEKAKLNRIPGFSDVALSWLEDFLPQPNTFDLVVSSLALHYIEDLSALMRKVHQGLKPNGRFIFSVEHPVITSCNRSLQDTSLRQAWIVDDYFKRGAREVEWMGDKVTKFHRTIEDFLTLLHEAGFRLQSLKEAEPEQSQFEDEELFARRRRIPLFLVLAAQKEVALI